MNNTMPHLIQPANTAVLPPWNGEGHGMDRITCVRIRGCSVRQALPVRASALRLSFVDQEVFTLVDLYARAVSITLELLQVHIAQQTCLSGGGEPDRLSVH